ncbi:hypothetical protein BS47DRAFT_1338678 [Hydnum rufescens UP504]|uniref:Uncharacterized protein n=1 Tax=Hydnum rufescens UP504 TaxID=1448309 RepID=A0A9P6B634_9AGAM|nr:hypothetical protein BS47DRAFT_1338678 [Hydnum rufescens UP504]
MSVAVAVRTLTAQPGPSGSLRTGTGRRVACKTLSSLALSMSLKAGNSDDIVISDPPEGRYDQRPNDCIVWTPGG